MPFLLVVLSFRVAIGVDNGWSKELQFAAKLKQGQKEGKGTKSVAGNPGSSKIPFFERVQPDWRGHGLVSTSEGGSTEQQLRLQHPEQKKTC